MFEEPKHGLYSIKLWRLRNVVDSSDFVIGCNVCLSVLPHVYGCIVPEEDHSLMLVVLDYLLHQLHCVLGIEVAFFQLMKHLTIPGTDGELTCDHLVGFGGRYIDLNVLLRQGPRRPLMISSIENSFVQLVDTVA